MWIECPQCTANHIHFTTTPSWSQTITQHGENGSDYNGQVWDNVGGLPQRTWIFWLLYGFIPQTLASYVSLFSFIFYFYFWTLGLVSDQLVTLTTTTPPTTVRITGITSDYGLLRTMPERTGWSSSTDLSYIDLQPDGNSFDLMTGMIKLKTWIQSNKLERRGKILRRLRKIQKQLIFGRLQYNVHKFHCQLSRLLLALWYSDSIQLITAELRGMRLQLKLTGLELNPFVKFSESALKVEWAERAKKFTQINVVLLTR